MKQSRRSSFQKTLAFTATVAALGASVGVPVEQALAFTLVEDSAAKKGAQSSLTNNGAVQQKQRTGATQAKFKANQQKLNNAKAMGDGSAGSNVMLNPQPLPPKQGVVGIKSSGKQNVPAVQK